MNEAPTLLVPAQTKPELPLPTLPRWQPLRLGLVELFRYDSEEFWFRDGHLLLRGNNGTGKSKVLSLTLPFLLDAQLKPSRVEPDGDNGKRMAWNLLMNSYDRRIGYTWLEFGRVAEDGTPRYLSIGAGLAAAAGRPHVESWFFVIEEAEKAPRINEDIWLTSAQRVVLTKERLREALEGRGQVFETATSYRRAIDERLFHLGARRYDALMDTLIQLRQPQLSKKPDETALSDALTEALPPLAPDLLGDVAEALGQLEEDRRLLEEYKTLARHVQQFESRYRVYAGTLSRRQARTVRQAQTEFDNASRARAEAQAAFDAAQASEAQARLDYDYAEITLAGRRARLEELRSDPTMQDANRLESAEKEADLRRSAFEAAGVAVRDAQGRVQRSVAETARAFERAAQAERSVNGLRQDSTVHASAIGIAARHADSSLATLAPAALVEMTERAFEGACTGLRNLVVERREQIRLMRERCAELKHAEDVFAHRRNAQEEQRREAEMAIQHRADADAEVEWQGRSLVRTWQDYLDGLRQLQVDPAANAAALATLADWVVAIEGDNPAQRLLQHALEENGLRLAKLHVDLKAQRQAFETERDLLDDERIRLEDGRDIAPPAPYTRDADARSARAGAPLWQLIDFRAETAASQRAGLEAALEAAGLLDAWLSPDGQLQTRDSGFALHDAQILPRPGQTHSLADWLQAAVPANCALPPHLVEHVLSGIACADDDPADCEAWIAPDGRFRLGTLAGAWAKPEAVYIGHAARMAARARRLAEITDRLAQLAENLRAVQAAAEQLARDQDAANAEWRGAPADGALRSAHFAAKAAAVAAQSARERLAEAETRCQKAEQALTTMRERVAVDAADLRLPLAASELSAIETTLDQYQDAQLRLAQAIRELRTALPDLQRQQGREHELRTDLAMRERQLATARIEAEEASARFAVLRDAVGTKVDELRQQLSDARADVEKGEARLRHTNDALRIAGEARAVAETNVNAANATLQERTNMRSDAVARLQRFVSTGLLSSALPEMDLPDMSVPWTIDPALALARRAEQALVGLKDDDDTWTRIQRQFGDELTGLQTALAALGHQAPAEPNDWGFAVHIIYQNRPERPDRLAARLMEEIAQRSELLTAHEREILEAHLQDEVASEVQHLLQAADQQVDAINKELYVHPTSTGVRFRLVWEPLSEEEGAPVGLSVARKRLLNTNSELWSEEDRKVVGTMLQQRIAAERERADAAIGQDGGGSILEQLARALDYRYWHRFRVERGQDGHWRKLSGPASSGERALGLTVPLFAAIASFYGQGSYKLAPRLMLLDEAFAGIDDAARAHCMALIRQFDLDFVITSEREWGCYAELPGVAICQLQQREGIDAVFVSRWAWDGRARRRESDPDRRFAPT
jgi:uncharacterized protein (TIGR02680 family)